LHTHGLGPGKQHSHRQPPKLFLGDGTIQVLDISVEDNTVRINSTVVPFLQAAANG
jgi:hypothetical protein